MSTSYEHMEGQPRRGGGSRSEERCTDRPLDLQTTLMNQPNRNNFVAARGYRDTFRCEGKAIGTAPLTLHSFPNDDEGRHATNDARLWSACATNGARRWGLLEESTDMNGARRSELPGDSMATNGARRLELIDESMATDGARRSGQLEQLSATLEAVNIGRNWSKGVSGWMNGVDRTTSTTMKTNAWVMAIVQPDLLSINMY